MTIGTLEERILRHKSRHFKDNITNPTKIFAGRHSY